MRRRSVPALLAAAVLASCGQVTNPPETRGPASSAGTAPSTATSASGSPHPPATRLDVAISEDATRSTSADIGVDGGVLELDLGAGMSAKLTIPRYALIETTPITMTAATLGDWPDAPADQASVQLEPDGLELFVPADLTFTRPDLGPDGTYGNVAWTGAGTNLHSTGGSRAGNAVSLEVRHFSGYGLTWNIGNEAYWSSWSRIQIDGAIADLENDLSMILGFWRSQQLLGGEPSGSLEDVMPQYLDTWYDAVYEPMMRMGETTCEGGRMALELLISLFRHLQLAGIDPAAAYESFKVRRHEGQSTQYDFGGIPLDYVDDLVKRCDEEALVACRATGDIGLLRLYLRDRTELLAKAGANTPESGERLLDLCGRYRLDATFTFGQDFTLLYENSTVPELQQNKQWEMHITADLRWIGLDPLDPTIPIWEGVLFGEGRPTPTVRQLEFRTRRRHVEGGDTGTVDKGWYPWCDVEAHFDHFHSWPIQAPPPQFKRVRMNYRFPIPAMGIDLGPGRGIALDDRVIEHEGPLRTQAFISALVQFLELPAPNETLTSACGNSGTDSSAYELFSTLRAAQPAVFHWELTNEGLGSQDVQLKEADEHPFVARDEQTDARDETVGRGTSSLIWNSVITLTHTPG